MYVLRRITGRRLGERDPDDLTDSAAATSGAAAYEPTGAAQTDAIAAETAATTPPSGPVPISPTRSVVSRAPQARPADTAAAGQADVLAGQYIRPRGRPAQTHRVGAWARRVTALATLAAASAVALVVLGVGFLPQGPRSEVRSATGTPGPSGAPGLQVAGPSGGPSAVVAGGPTPATQPTATGSSAARRSPAPSVTPGATVPGPTATARATPRATAHPTSTPAATVTPAPTGTPVVLPTPTETPVPTPTETPAPTPTDTPPPTPTDTPPPTPTPTAEASVSIGP
jgi:hypothetical protein